MVYVLCTEQNNNFKEYRIKQLVIPCEYDISHYAFRNLHYRKLV